MMLFIKKIMESPLYSFLFGSSGVLLIIVTFLGIVVKRKKKKNYKDIENHNNQLEDQIEHKDKEDYENKTVYDNIDFLSDLAMNSPVKDKIKLDRITDKDKRYF